MDPFFISWLTFEAGRIVGRSERFKINGDEDKEKIKKALLKSPVWLEMVRSGMTLEEIEEKIQISKLRGKKFEKALKVPYPL